MPEPTAGDAAPATPPPPPPPTFAQAPPRRINITGPAGSGKSTLAARLAAALSLPHLELDSVFHGPGWTPRAEFVADVEAFLRASPGGWVVDGNYRKCRGLVWARPYTSPAVADPDPDALPGADTIVVLDLPKRTVLASLFLRTMSRVVYRTPLWHGNTETWANVLSTDPKVSVMAYCYSEFEAHRRRLVEAEAAGQGAGVRWVRLRSRAEVEAFARAVEGAAGEGAAGKEGAGDGASA
ncbi:hypothetical protein Q8F55_002235 [Vanrija albida]|uniref:(d)CMP kinase n=1 Tax=Vanrija albida TaxID=181172 RepID=A0ABR3Q980_9TREE